VSSDFDAQSGGEKAKRGSLRKGEQGVLFWRMGVRHSAAAAAPGMGLELPSPAAARETPDATRSIGRCAEGGHDGQNGKTPGRQGMDQGPINTM
jgi:hypothetical protein